MTRPPLARLSCQHLCARSCTAQTDNAHCFCTSINCYCLVDRAGIAVSHSCVCDVRVGLPLSVATHTSAVQVMSTALAPRPAGGDVQDGLLALSAPRSPSPATPSLAAVRIHSEHDEPPTVVHLGSVTSKGRTAVIGHDNQQLVFHHDSPSSQPSALQLSPTTPPLPALHLGSSPTVSSAYDWKLLPSRPLPPAPATAATTQAASTPTVIPAAVVPSIADDASATPTPTSPHRSHSYVSAARASFTSNSPALRSVHIPAQSVSAMQSPLSAPPSFSSAHSQLHTSHTPRTPLHTAHPPLSQPHSQHGVLSSGPAPLVSSSSLSSVHPSLPSSSPLSQPQPSRATSAPPVAPLAHSRYSILGLPRPRRLAPVSPVIAAQAALFHQPPLSLSPIKDKHLRPAATSVAAAGIPHRLHTQKRKSWDVRDMWLLREQEEIRKEEEKYQARVQQLTKALNLCRLFPPLAAPLPSSQVESIVKQLHIDLAHLDVGHITTMEREELMLDSPRTLLAVLQLLSSYSLSLSAVKQQLAELRVGGDISEYVVFFFVDAPAATFDNASRAYSRSRSRQSVRTPQLTVSTISPESRHGRRTLPRDTLSALTSYINRRQTEDRVKEEQVAQYATNVGFDINKVNLLEAEAMLGASQDVEEQRANETPAAVSAQQHSDEEQTTSLSQHSANASTATTTGRAGPPPLHSAKQVVLALQMLYEPVVYDDEHVLSLCEQASMAPETTQFMMRKNRDRREAQLEQDRRERRKRKQLQSAASATSASSSSAVLTSSTAAPRHWPVTVEDVSNMISNHRLCRGWISDPDELRELVRVTPLDLSRVSPVMLEELLAADLRFDSPRQVVRALSLLYADLSQDEVKEECKRSGLSHSAQDYILRHRQVYEELELELTAEDVKVEAIKRQRRKKQAKIKALNILQYDIVQTGADEEEIAYQPARAKQISITQLTDSVRSSQLFDREVLITEEQLTTLLDEHPFPLSTVDLRQLSIMKDRGLSFSSPVQLVSTLELLHADMDDDAVQIECTRRGISPSVAQYVIQHDRPIHAEMMISRENSKAHRRSGGGHHINRRSLSLVDTLGGGQQLVEEFVGFNTIADIIGGSTTPQQLSSAIRQAKLLRVDDSVGEEQLVSVAQALEFELVSVAEALEFDLSVVQVEIIPILSQHASTFSSVPQLLTALQLLYTDVSDAEIRSECEEVGMDRKTTKFLVKNSLRKLLKSEHVTKQLEGGWLESAEDGEIIVGRPGGSGDKRSGWSDPRYARVVYAGEDDLGIEQLVEMNGEQRETTKLDMRLLLQLLQLCSLLDLGSVDASAPVHVQEERIQSACSALSFDLSRADKEICLAMYSADCRFASLKQLVQCFVALYSDISSDEVRAFCEGVKPPFTRQVVDFIAVHALRQRKRRAKEQRAKQLQSAESRNTDASSNEEVTSAPTAGWFSSSAQLSQLIDQFQLLSPSGCSSADVQTALAACGLALVDVRLADLAKLAEEKMTFSTPEQLAQTLALLGRSGSEEQIRQEAIQLGLPPHIVRYIDEHREEHLRFAERGRKKQMRQRHRIRYISHDLRQEDDDVIRDELSVQGAAQRHNRTARALYAKIVSQKSDLLVEQVVVDEDELNEWLVHLPPGVSELNVECVDLIADQLRVDIAGEGKRRYGNVKDVLQSVIDLTFEVAELAEEEQVSVDDMVGLMKAGQRQVPAVIVNSSPESESARSPSPRTRLTPVPSHMSGSHARVSSMPNSRRNSGSIHTLQHQSSAPVIGHNSAHPASRSGSPSPSPTASALKGDGRHRRGAHSVSWNAKSKEVAAGSSDKRDAQIRELKRMIWQNGLVMAPQELERPSAQTEPPSPEPPPLLSQRKSHPTSPQSSSQRLGERDRGATVPIATAASPSSTQSRLLPPPVPAGYLKVNTSSSPSTSALSAAPGVSPSSPLPPPLPPSAATTSSAPAAVVPAPVAILDVMYNWDLIVDPVYSIHLICELLKWRAVHQPELYFSSPSLLFDFLHDPSCPVFDVEEDALDTRRTAAMELTDTDAGDRDRDNTLTLTAYEERDRSTLHTRTMSGSMRSQRQARQQHVSLTAQATPPPLPPPTATMAPLQSASSSASASTTASISPSDSTAAPPPPLPPTAFPTPPFSPTVLLTINHPFVYPPTVDALSSQRRLQVDHSIANTQQHNGMAGQPAEEESAVGCCGMSKTKGQQGSACIIL